MTTQRPAVGDRRVLVPDAPAAGGAAAARTEDGVVFVDGALPGETVEVELTQVKKRFARARVTSVVEPSEHRVPDRLAACGAAGVGGVEFASVDLAYSRRLKAEAARQQLERIGGIEWDLRVSPLPREADGGSGMDWRTRVQLAVGPDGQPGLRAGGSHRVVPVSRIPLAVDELNDLGLHRQTLPGLSRLELVASAGGGAIIAVGQPKEAVLGKLREIAAAQPGAWSVLLRTEGKRNRGRPAPPQVLAGTGRVREEVRGQRFGLDADGFWQVHVDAADVLSAKVLEFASRPQSALDLYCGAGLFSVFLAKAGAKVTGIEGSQAAIQSARANAEGLPAKFEVGRIEKLGMLPPADTVVLDPPRAGAGEDVVNTIGASAAGRVVYVSCDAGTFARDARGLLDCGFELAHLEGWDAFPLTKHTEFTAVFTR